MITRPKTAGPNTTRPATHRQASFAYAAAPRRAACAKYRHRARTALAVGALLLALAGICPTGAATILPATISSDQTWNRAGEPYELHSDVTIQAGATVTVKPGVTIIAQGNWRLTVSGGLIVLTDGGTRAMFRASDPDAVGAWQGLYFTQGSTGNLKRCTIRSAAYGVLADSANIRLENCRVLLSALDALYVWGDTWLRMEDCTLQDNGRHGLQVQTSKPWGYVQGTTFQRCGGYPCLLKATCVELLSADNSYLDNSQDLIGVDCGSSPDIEDEDTWVDQGVPYELNAGGANQELQIAAGGSLKIRSNVRMYPPRRIVVAGELAVSGTGSERVTIAPPGSPTPGDWLGIAFSAGSYGRLANVTIRWAREAVSMDDASVELIKARIYDSELDGVYVGGTSDLQVAESNFRGCGRSGLRLPQPSSTGSVTDSRFVECGDYPVYAAASFIEGLGAGNSYARNARQAIGVSCSQDPDISDDDTWTAQTVPYDLSANAEGTYLRVAAGGRLELSAGVRAMGGGIGASGTLIAEGVDGNPVTMGSAATTPAPGDWTGVEYLPGGSGWLAYTNISHAQTGVSIASAGSVRLSHTTISDCAGDGVRVSGSATPIVRNCTIRDNATMGIRISDTAQPQLGIHGNGTNPGQNSLFGNGSYDLYNNTALAQRAEDNWWDATTVAGINARIYDYNDNPSRGAVDFQPFLTTQPAGLGTPSGTALAIMSVAAAPTAHGAAIHVSLSRPAEVQITIRNIAGRPVRELGANVESSGVVTWDRRNTAGTVAPAGRYLIEVTARAPDGSKARGLAMVELR